MNLPLCRVLILGVVLAGTLTPAGPEADGAPLVLREGLGGAPTDWPMFRFDLRRDGSNPLETILNTDNVDQLEAAWSHTIGTGNNYGQLYSSPAVVGGIVYVASARGRLLAFDATTGELLWKTHSPEFIESSPAVAQGVVYVGVDDNFVHAYDALTGIPLWAFRTGSIVRSSPAVSDGVLFIRSLDGYAYAIEASTGTLIWKRMVSASGMTESESSIAVSGGSLYLVAGEGVLALNASNGDVQWETGCGGDPGQPSPAVVDGVVYVGFVNGFVCAFDAGTGDLIWSVDRGTGVGSSPAVAGGAMYFAEYLSGDGHVTSLDTSTGMQRWSVDPHFLLGQASPAFANGVLYLPTRGRAMAFDPATGDILWSQRIMARHYPSSPAVVDGRVYLSVEDLRVFSFALP